MTAPEAHLNPETLDELLSADLDGAFERAATDLGYTADEARAAMQASPDMPRRRGELIRARDLLAAPVPVPGSVTSQLVTSALDHSDELRSIRARRTRALRVVLSVGSAAAVIAGIVAFAALNHPSSTSRSTAATATLSPYHAPTQFAPSAPTSGRFVDFGDVSRPATLRAAIEMRLRTTMPAPAATAHRSASAGAIAVPDIVAKLASMGSPGVPGPVGLQGPQGLEGVEGLQGDVGIAGPTGPTGAQGGTGSAGAIGPQGPSGAQGVTGPTSATTSARSAPKAAPRFGAVSPATADTESGCVASIERRTGQRSAPVLSGFGTDARRPVLIVVFSHGHQYGVYVLAASDCAVVSYQTLP